MLFGYPIEATFDNWLHDCLQELLDLIHTSTDKGESIPNWPEILPGTYRKRLEKRTGLRDRIENYYLALKELTPIERSQVWQAFKDQNQIPLLLSGQLDCQITSELPFKIQQPIEDLFEFSFRLLTGLRIRDRHYQTIYNTIKDRVCPFCGCEDFDPPDAPREDLDHYLPESKYCFVAANLRNLVPMGGKCNKKYKLAKDILRKEDGSRRKCFDPYNHQEVKVSLEKSTLFDEKTEENGKPLIEWVVEFYPNSEEVTTWNEVFCIQERYKQYLLNADFDYYVDEFVGYCQSQKNKTPLPKSQDELVEEIQNYIFVQECCGLKGRSFLKVAVFQVLLIHCRDGNQKLIEFILYYIHKVKV